MPKARRGVHLNNSGVTFQRLGTESFEGAVMRSRVLTRTATIWVIAGFVAAVGSAGMAAADNGVVLPESSAKNRDAEATAACMPPPTGPAYQGWRNSAEAYNSGRWFLQQKANDRAAAALDTAIKIYPNNALAHVGRGQIFGAEGKYDRAIDMYSQAIKIAPGCFIALNSRCWARAIRDDLQAALTDCNEALRLHQGGGARRAAFLDSRALVYLKMGNLDKAIADYDAALQISPDQPESLYGRGKARLLKGDEPRGTFDITTAKRHKPDIADEMSRYGLK